jgi:hypothetical protein
MRANLKKVKEMDKDGWNSIQELEWMAPGRMGS